MIANYDENPSVFSKTQKTITYRWDIIKVTNEENNITSYKCNEVTLFQPVCREKLTQAVINELWSNDDEKKLINDYNSAMITKDDDNAVIKYKAFLEERNRVKGQIKQDYKLINL